MFQKAFREILDKLPNAEHDREVFCYWWKNNGERWICELRQLCIAHFNIGYIWQFTREQKRLLNQYYAANLLLVECMNRSYVSKQVREEIEATMLLPVKEKVERKKEKIGDR